MTKQEFLAVTKQELKAQGFKLWNGKPYLDLPDIIVVIDLQKSNCGATYFINFAFVFKALHTTAELQTPHKCEDGWISRDRDSRLLFPYGDANKSWDKTNRIDGLRYEELDIEVYRKDLKVAMHTQIDPIRERGIDYIKEIRDKNFFGTTYNTDRRPKILAYVNGL